MRVVDIVARELAELGVGHVFAVVGSGNFDVTNALAAEGVPVVTARHEGGAATMGDAYSRASDLPAVVTLHQGCGLTNAVTGIGEAAKSRTPLIVLAADVSVGAVTSNFHIDQDALVRAVGAVAERLHSPATARDDIRRAYRTAVADRRTVVVSMPLDVQSAPAPDPAPVVRAGKEPSLSLRPSAPDVQALADAIRRAHRPVFIAGRGARGARGDLQALAAASGALLATSAVANGLFVDDEWSIGISGGFSSPTTAELITGADLVVAWGCALNGWTTRQGALLSADAVLVQVDLDPLAIRRHRPVDLAVIGDVSATAIDVRASLAEEPRPDQGYRTEEVRTAVARSSRWNDVETPDLSSDDTIDPRLLSRRLDEILPAERVVAVDSGNFMGYPSAYLRVPDERAFCFTQAFQSIGLGLASAIGSALAQPGRLPVLATGDGGFLMAISELDTAVRLSLPLLIVVYDDAAYGAEVHHFGEDADLRAVTFPETDLAAIARGHGAGGVTVRALEDLAPVVEWLDDPRGPLVVDAKIASDGGAWWLHEAFRAH